MRAAENVDSSAAQGDDPPEPADGGLPRYVVHLLMTISATLVSTSFIVGADLAPALDPVTLTLIRFFIASTIFAPLVLWRSGLQISLQLILRCSLISLCLVVFFVCMFWSLRYTTALNTSILFALVPSISWGYSFLLGGESLTARQLVALGCGIVGVIWVIFRGDPGVMVDLSWNKGDLIFLAGCFAMGLYTPLVKRLHRGESMAVMTCWVLITGTGWLLLAMGKSLFQLDWAAIPGFVWGGILYLAIFTTIVTFFLTQLSVPYLGPTRVMAYSYLYPALVLALELLFGHDMPSGFVLPGVVIVLVAMFVVQSDKSIS